MKKKNKKVPYINEEALNKNDLDDWSYASALSFAKGYGEDEPDYDKIAVKESNPEYRPSNS
jgi:hypothetical protein